MSHPTPTTKLEQNIQEAAFIENKSALKKRAEEALAKAKAIEAQQIANGAKWVKTSMFNTAYLDKSKCQ